MRNDGLEMKGRSLYCMCVLKGTQAGEYRSDIGFSSFTACIFQAKQGVHVVASDKFWLILPTCKTDVCTDWVPSPPLSNLGLTKSEA